MDEFLLQIFLVVGSYFLGSIPTGKIICAQQGIDIQNIGSKNTGATNVSRALGMKWAALVGLCDISKAFVPTLVALRLQQPDWLVCSVALAASLGHVFSTFLKFTGGKAVSTYIGSLLAIIPLYTFGWIIVWFLAIKLINIMSLVNLVMLLLFIPILWMTQGWLFGLYGFLMWLLIMFAHRSNVQRLLQGKELSIKQ